MRAQRGDALDSGGNVYLAAVISLTVGMIHFAVTPEYLSEWWGYGFFFIMAAIGQVSYALVLFMQPWRYNATGGVDGGGYRAARPVFLAAAWINACFIALYILTRTVGIPLFGPEAGQVEPVTILSLIVQISEVLLVACLVQVIRRADRFASRALEEARRESARPLPDAVPGDAHP